MQPSSLNTSGQLGGVFLVLFVKAEPWEAGGGTAVCARQESFKGFSQKYHMKNEVLGQTTKERGRPAVSPLQVNNSSSNKNKASVLPTSIPQAIAGIQIMGWTGYFGTKTCPGQTLQQERLRESQTNTARQVQECQYPSLTWAMTYTAAHFGMATQGYPPSGVICSPPGQHLGALGGSIPLPGLCNRTKRSWLMSTLHCRGGWRWQTR